MWLADFLARRIRRFAIPNLTMIILIGQVFFYGLWTIAQIRAQPELLDDFFLYPLRVLNGEVWRLFTFVLIPPPTNVLFFFFYCFLFYLMGTALENQWGPAHFNVFLLVGYLANVAAVMTVGLATGIDLPAHGAFVNGTIFLAFAYLFPNFELMIFFILPVKVKWLALLQWLGYGYYFATGSWVTKVLIAASVANFLLFFGGEIVSRMKSGRRSMKWRAKQLSAARIRHHCTICGINSETHPEMDFRYCSKCAGNLPYCSEHLRNHVHVTEETTPPSKPHAPVN